MLLRSLEGGTAFAPDLQLVEARPGERYLLCTDGLTGVLPAETIQDVLTTAGGPDQAVRDLVRLAREAGAPDNAGCVVGELAAA